MKDINEILDLERKVFEPAGLPNNIYDLNSPNPEIALQKTRDADEYVTGFLKDYSLGIREVMRMFGYNVPVDRIAMPEMDFGTADLPQTIENENGRLVYKGVAMVITGANGRYHVNVNPRMASASEIQFNYKLLHEYTHALMDMYGLTLENHDLEIEKRIDVYAAHALGKPELVNTSGYINSELNNSEFN